MGKLCSFEFKCVVLNFFVYKYLIPRMASKQSSYVELVIHRLFILYSIAVLLICIVKITSEKLNILYLLWSNVDLGTSVWKRGHFCASQGVGQTIVPR